MPLGDRRGIQCRTGALRAAVSDSDKRERDKQIEFANGHEWYTAGEKLRPHDLVTGLLKREQDALGLGYTGLRTNGNCAWVSREQWTGFLEYEVLVQKSVRNRRMICMCSYCLDQLPVGSHMEVMERHDMAMPGARHHRARALRMALWLSRLTPSTK